MKKILVTALSLLLSANAFSHGEDKLGPNGGYIRMPGAFHTEVVELNPNQIRVYLLDINFKNPTLADSELKITTKAKKLIRAKCKAEEKSYLCDFPKSMSLKRSGRLLVTATRAGQKGVPVSYLLPLSANISQEEDHGAHH